MGLGANSSGHELFVQAEIVSGIAAIEMWITGSVNSVIFTPTLFCLALLNPTCNEKYSSKQLGFTAVIFCFFQ